MLFNRRKKLPLTIDPNDTAAIAHENEVLAREEPESIAGGDMSTPTDIGTEILGGVRLGPGTGGKVLGPQLGGTKFFRNRFSDLDNLMPPEGDVD